MKIINLALLFSVVLFVAGNVEAQTPGPATPDLLVNNKNPDNAKIHVQMYSASGHGIGSGFDVSNGTHNKVSIPAGETIIYLGATVFPKDKNGVKAAAIDPNIPEYFTGCFKVSAPGIYALYTGVGEPQFKDLQRPTCGIAAPGK